MLHSFLKQFEFFKFRKPAFAASWLLVIAGVVSVVVHHDNIMGIDFTGGDEMTVSYEQRIDIGDLQESLKALDWGQVNPGYQSLIGTDKEILKLQTRFDQSRAVLSALQGAFPEAGFAEVGVTQIGASVSDSIQTNAFLSVLAALMGILLYVALRFEVGYGVGAVVATVHDVLMTIGIFVLCGQFGLFVSGQFTAPMIAAILMMLRTPAGPIAKLRVVAESAFRTPTCGASGAPTVHLALPQIDAVLVTPGGTAGLVGLARAHEPDATGVAPHARALAGCGEAWVQAGLATQPAL